jgi:hypothetical protein
MDTKQAYTDELLSYFAARRSEASRETVPALRDIALKAAHDAEWYTLFSALLIPSMRDLYDGGRVAKRLDEMRADMLAAI